MMFTRKQSSLCELVPFPPFTLCELVSRMSISRERLLTGPGGTPARSASR
jgi:hypothetical protein